MKTSHHSCVNKHCYRSTEVILPIPLPTWNRLLAMGHWQRKKLREMIHFAVSTSITYGTNWPTQITYQGKLCSTDSFMQDYLQTIRPKKSSGSGTPKKKFPKRKKK